MKFDVTNNNRNACADFIRYNTESLFDINVKSKLKRLNFITVLRDGATDAAIIEKECAFVLFVDLDEFTPTMAFYSLKQAPSQNAKKIETAIRQSFAENDLSHLVFCMFFLQVMLPM